MTKQGGKRTTFWAKTTTERLKKKVQTTLYKPFWPCSQQTHADGFAFCLESGVSTCMPRKISPRQRALSGSASPLPVSFPPGTSQRQAGPRRLLLNKYWPLKNPIMPRFWPGWVPPSSSSHQRRCRQWRCPKRNPLPPFPAPIPLFSPSHEDFIAVRPMPAPSLPHATFPKLSARINPPRSSSAPSLGAKPISGLLPRPVPGEQGPGYFPPPEFSSFF